MRRVQWARVAFAAFAMWGASTVASAGPILYNLTFTGGSTTPTGSFTYDSSVAVNPFASFNVNAGGVAFNLTGPANAFTGNSSVGACKSAQSAAGFFNALTTPGCLNKWDYLPAAGSNLFTIRACAVSATPCLDGAASGFDGGSAGSGASTSGLVTAAASGVPEPGTASFVCIGALALMATARARTKRRAGGRGSPETHS